MKTGKNTVVTLAYKIHEDSPEGTLIEQADELSPRNLILGLDRTIPGFEQNISGLETGEDFKFQLSPEEAFGQYRDDMVVNVPKSAFVVDGQLREDLLYVNNEIKMMDNQGNPVSGLVREVLDEVVVMDFNHALAGKSLFVEGKIIAVRPVTPEDLQPSDGCGCGSGCGCESAEPQAEHHHEYEEDCPTCGNPADQRGQGIGNCGCG